MAYYNVNRIIKLTRIAVGMTKEELCEGICSVITLSRIEKDAAVKKDIYKQLMKRMGRIAEGCYVVGAGHGGSLLEEQEEMEKAFRCQDYEEAEQCLLRMKCKADNNVLTKQYLSRAEALAEYYQKRIGERELFARISEVLRWTVPEYERYAREDKLFPFVKEELLAVMNLGTIYSLLGDYEKSLRTYGIVLRCLDADYIGMPDNQAIRIAVHYNISKVYEYQGKNEEALKKINNCLKMAEEIGYGRMFAKLLVSKADNFIKLAEQEKKEVMHDKFWDEADKCLREAYYIAAARKDEDYIKIIRNYNVEGVGKCLNRRNNSCMEHQQEFEWNIGKIV